MNQCKAKSSDVASDCSSQSPAGRHVLGDAIRGAQLLDEPLLPIQRAILEEHLRICGPNAEMWDTRLAFTVLAFSIVSAVVKVLEMTKT